MGKREKRNRVKGGKHGTICTYKEGEQGETRKGRMVGKRKKGKVERLIGGKRERGKESLIGGKREKRKRGKGVGNMERYV